MPKDKPEENFNIISPFGIMVYLHCWEPFKFKEDEGDEEKEARFSCKVVVKKNAQGVKEAKDTVQRAAYAKFGEKVVKELLRDRKSTRLNSSHVSESRMPSSA